MHLTCRDGSKRELSGHVINARASDAEENPELFAAVVHADTRALCSIVENPKAAGDLLYKMRYASMSKDVWSLVWEKNISQFRSPYVSKESIEAWVTMGVTSNPIDPKSVDVSRLIDIRFVDQAVQKIGRKVQA